MREETYHDDEQLVSCLKQGDKEAFHELYQKYVSRLYYHVLKFAKSPELAQDTVHDVFVKIWECRDTLRADLSFQSYLFTIAKNQLLNLFKRSALETAILQEMMTHTKVARRTTEEALRYQETNTLISQAIDQLPPQRKRIYELCRKEGLTYEEVAQSLGITKGTVNSQMVKSLKSIKDYLLLNGDLLIALILLSLFI